MNQFHGNFFHIKIFYFKIVPAKNYMWNNMNQFHGNFFLFQNFPKGKFLFLRQNWFSIWFYEFYGLNEFDNFIFFFRIWIRKITCMSWIEIALSSNQIIPYSSKQHILFIITWMTTKTMIFYNQQDFMDQCVFIWPRRRKLINYYAIISRKWMWNMLLNW